MQSKTSLFNKTIFKNNIKRVWPFWGLLSFAAVIPSLFLAVERLREYGDVELNPLDIKHAYYAIAAYGAPFVAFGTAIIAAMIVWSYLYSARSVSCYHALPITRTGLFVTQYLSGLAIMLIPYAIGGGVFVLTLLLLGGGFSMATFVCIGAVIADSIFFFSFATLIAHLTGNVLALPAFYMVFNFVFIGIENVLNFVGNTFLFGLSYELSDKTGFLTPIYQLLSKVEVDAKYSEWSPFSTGGSRLIDVTMNNYKWIIIYAAVGVVFTVLSLMIYKKRKSETAGDVVSTRTLKPFIHAIYAIVVTCLLGMLLYYIFSEGLNDTRLNPFMAILCFGAALTIAYYTGLMLLERTIKVFNKKSMLGFIGGLVAVVIVTFGIKFDFLGIEKRVPKTSSFEKMTILSNNDYVLTSDRDAELIEKARELHKLIIDNKKTILARKNSENAENVFSEYITFEYYLKNDRRMIRRYNVVFDKERDKDLYERYKAFMTDKDLTASLFHDVDDFELENVDYSIDWVGYDAYPTGEKFNYEPVSEDYQKKLFDAVFADLEAGNWQPGFSEKETVAFIYINYRKLVEQSGNRSYYTYDTISVYVKPDMVNCLKAIAETLGVPYEDVKRDADAYAEYRSKEPDEYGEIEYYYYD